MSYKALTTLSEDWRRDNDYYKVADYLADYVGVSQRQKVMDDLADFLYFAKLDWAHKHRQKFSPEVALVCVADPHTHELFSIGGSLPSDLFVDNFGIINADAFRQPVVGNPTTYSITDTTNASKLYQHYGGSNGSSGAGNQMWGEGGTNAVGSKIQVGSSVVAPTRADVQIGTAFGTAPENALFSTGAGSYSAGSGNVTVSGSITSGGAGTINEAILCYACNKSDSANTTVNCAIAHDATTAAPFTAGKSITVQYSLTD